MKQNYIKQVMVLNDQNHKEYLEDFKEEPLSFEDFVNFMLGTLYDNEHIIEQIIPNNDGSIFFIVYLIRIVKKHER
jgi:hypothetical protein